MAEQRLPIVNSDDGTWGDILRQYLMKEHYNGDVDLTQATSTNGGHQFVTIRPGTTSTAPLTLTSGSLLSTPAIGAIEFNNDTLYFTKTTGVTRMQVVTDIGTQTLTNKTLSGANNTFSNIPESAVTNLTADLAAKATDANVVHLAGNETITGDKSFTGAAEFNQMTYAKEIWITPTNGTPQSAAFTLDNDNGQVWQNTNNVGGTWAIWDQTYSKAPIAVQPNSLDQALVVNAGGVFVQDRYFTLNDDADPTKQARFQLSGITSGQNRQFTLPDANTTLVGTDTAQTLTNKTIIGSTGMLVPVQCHTDGSETYTISGGSVTQIAGTTIQGTTPYSPAVGDRILILTAPASTGAGVQFSMTTQPANGIYVVTSNTTNLSLSRATDMSGSVSPAGLSVYSENSTVGWLPQTIWTVTIPSSPAAFTWGTTSLRWGSTGGRTMTPNYIYLGVTANQIGMWNGTGSTYISSAASAGNQSFTLPATATSDTLVGRASTDTLTNKRITSRVVSVSSSATPSINTDNGDHFNLTALAVAVTSMTTNLTGTPTDGQRFMLRIKDNGTARAITWGASFLSSGGAKLITTTSANMTHHIGFIWDAAKSAWVCIAVDAIGY